MSIGATIVYADQFDTFLGKINESLINPAIEFGFIIALVVFLYGVFLFIARANIDAEREKGKKHIVWGLVGFLIMFGVFGIIKLLANTIGVGGGLQLDNQKQSFEPPCIQEVRINNESQGSILPCK